MGEDADVVADGGERRDARRLATVELLGALTYGQLRSFESTARAVRLAPDSRQADKVSNFAVREHEAYHALRTHLVSLTDLGGAVMDRQKPLFDSFFDLAPLEDWLGACTFFAVGLPLASDFCREIAPALEPETAEVVVAALGHHHGFEEYAIDQVLDLISHDDAAHERTRGTVADLLGRALTGFQASVADTDALKVLLEGDEGEDAGGSLVKRVALAVLAGHRRRMNALGLDDLV